MGRGRQKAKHTKVARDLKYFSPDTNYGALAKELGAPGDPKLAEDLEKWPEFAATSDGSYTRDIDTDEYDTDDDSVSSDESKSA